MYRVDQAACTGCGDCVDACPAEAIALLDGRARIDEAACADCGSCADACPQGAIRAEDAISVGATIAPWVDSSPLSRTATPEEALEPMRLPQVEIMSPVARRSQLWPMVGSALVWAARELLPEMLAAWRTSRAGVLQPASRESVTVGLIASKRSRFGHRHRWGRA